MANELQVDAAGNRTASASSEAAAVAEQPKDRHSYRTWISTEVGTVSRVANGLSATELAGGTLLSAPDDWPADRVAAMTETLAGNGRDEVPC